jgi:hypothetical protein
MPKRRKEGEEVWKLIMVFLALCLGVMALAEGSNSGSMSGASVSKPAPSGVKPCSQQWGG